MSENDTKSSEDFKQRLDPCGIIPTPKEPEELLDDANETVKNRWLAVFIQLARCERFLKFVEANYQIVDRIDDENKTITTIVLQNNKAVGPPLELAQTAKIYALLKMYNCRNSQKAMNDILKVLAQDEDTPSIITSATEKDVDEAADESSIKLS